MLELINQLARRTHRPYVLVEYAGSGIALSQFLRNRAQSDYRFEVHWRHPGEDKVTRAAKVLHMFEEAIHLLNIVGQNGWVQPYLHEFMNFPNGANDDQVDSLVQLLHINAFRLLVRMPKEVESTV